MNLVKGEEFHFHNLESKNASVDYLRLQLLPALHDSFPVSQQEILRQLRCAYIKVRACFHEGRQPV